MKQISRAAALSVAVAGILSVGLNMGTVSASERASVAPVKVGINITPNCSPNKPGGCNIYNVR